MSATEAIQPGDGAQPLTRSTNERLQNSEPATSELNEDERDAFRAIVREWIAAELTYAGESALSDAYVRASGRLRETHIDSAR